jgi:uncharacterized protein
VQPLALPFSRFLRVISLVPLLFTASRSCVAASAPSHHQRSDVISADIPATPGAADAVSQYKLASSLLFDAHAAPDYASALRLLRSSASQHFAPAQFLLGYLYEHGRGVAVDFDKAAENYRAAAEQGLAGAENNLGGLYQYGHGVPKDTNLAFKWYELAAKHGNAMGQYNLGTFYRLGYGTQPDLVRAAEWFRAAAEQGLGVAQANVSIAYFKGMGVPIDYTEAAHWALLAAEQGLPHAAMNYAYLCEQGLGVPRDDFAAYLWYSRAVAGGDKSGVSHVKSLAHRLSREQINQANSQLAADAAHAPQPGGASDTDTALMEKP